MGADAKAGNRVLAAVLPLAVLLAGCSGSSGKIDLSGHSRTRGYYKVGAPYQVKGVWYRPRVDYEYDETGIASWYGEAFHGKPTANGETFDLNQVSAAHKTLQLPSIVQVTNLQNGRSLSMRVNDRGPFAGDRIIDVSRRAAQLLGFEGAGTAPVRVKIMKEESIRVAEAAMRGDVGRSVLAEAPRVTQVRVAAAKPVSAPPVIAATADRQGGHPTVRVAARQPQQAQTAVPRPMVPADNNTAPVPVPVVAKRGPVWPSLIASAQVASHPPTAPVRESTEAAGRPSSRIFVQAGAFALAENAHRVRSQVAGLGSAEVSRVTVNGTGLYRVRLGPVVSDAEARRLLKKVVDSGFPDARVVGD